MKSKERKAKRKNSVKKETKQRKNGTNLKQKTASRESNPRVYLHVQETP